MWDKLNNGSSLDDVAEIYDDICILNSMSSIAIDSAKKEFNISLSGELSALTKKYKRFADDGRAIKPNFFAAKDRGKGYYNSDKKDYAKHDTTMDYVQTAVNSFRMHQSRGTSRKFIPFADLVDDDGYNNHNVWMPKVNRVTDLIRKSLIDMRNIYNAPELSDDDKNLMAFTCRQDCIDYIGNIVLTRNTMIYLLKHIEADKNRDICRAIFNTLFGYPNTSFFELINASATPIPELEEDPAGDIRLYDMRFRRACAEISP